MNTTKSYQHCINTLVFNMKVWSVKSQVSMQSSQVVTILNELALGYEQAWLSWCQSRTHGAKFRWVSSSWNICTDWSPIAIDCRLLRLYWLSYNRPWLWVLPINRSSSRPVSISYI